MTTDKDNVETDEKQFLMKIGKEYYYLFLPLVNYVIINYEKYVIHDITANNSTYFMRIHI